ncbi:MAG: acyl-protein synthetase [Elusimicrobia bacterium]|nr:acyl-protein synthetase [Elusimicrobiota bacterium]
MNSFRKADEICRISDPQDWTAEKCRLMVEACREAALFHFEKCPEIAALYRRRGFNPETLRREEDLERIPTLGVSAMKRYLLTSLPHEQAVLKLTSSGTRGQKTQCWLDQGSLDRAQAMLEGLWRQEGLVSDVPANYLMFVYDPEEAKDLGIAFSDKNQQRFAPVQQSFYAIRKSPDGGWVFRRKDVYSKLQEFSSLNTPTRIFGIPSFIHELLEETDVRVRLPAGSWMVTGGGWKAAEDKKVSRGHFRALASERLGLPIENIRDGYGMAEHAAPYLECARHRFHVPVYNRVFARDPVTMEALPAGRTGLLELVTPFNAMMPNLAILSTDLGFLNREPCPCGASSPTFTLAGRGGLTKHKGCAIHAGEIVARRAAGAKT